MSMPFFPGNFVRRNSATWISNTFDGWGRGQGIGVVLESPDILAADLDVRWPADRCFEKHEQLLPVTATPEMAAAWTLAWRELDDLLVANKDLKVHLPTGPTITSLQAKIWLQQAVLEGCAVSSFPATLAGKPAITMSKA